MSLKNQAVDGAIWSIAAGVGGRAVGLLATLALTHYLAPREYGAVMVAAIAAATVNTVTVLGLGHYVVANPKEGDRTVFHATFFHLTAGALALTALWLGRATVGRWLDTPELSSLLTPIAVAVAIERISYVPQRVLARDLRFKVLALRNLVAELAYAAVSVGFAVIGYGAHALVLGILARQVIAAAVVVAAVHPRRWLDVGKLSSDTTRRMFRYALPLALANPLYWLSRRGDNLLFAALFGPAVAGQYNLAYNLAEIPATHVGEHVGDVLMPCFAKIDSRSGRERALIRAASLLALVVFPLAVGLGAIAPTLVEALFPPAWRAMGPMLMVLCVLSVLRPIGWLLSSYLQAVKRTKLVLALEVLKAVLVMLLVVGLGRLGVLWACGGIGIAFGAHTIASCWAVQRSDGIAARELLRRLGPALVSCVPLVAVVVGLGLLAEGVGAPAWLALPVQIALGGAAYLVAARAVATRPIDELIELLRGAARRMSPLSGPA